jgi:hypothetical protein
MGRLSLNLLTASATVVLLAALTLPALAVRSSTDALSPSRTALPTRLFGVYVDPWHIDDWAEAAGAMPTMAAKFEAFSRRRTVTNFTAQAERMGIGAVLISWEPWKPVSYKLGVFRGARPQPGYRNVDIAHGEQDAYIRRFARALAGYDGIVYLRFAHEMNGFWYPWSHDPENYVRAWRHLVRLVRGTGAHNVRFLWSVNLNLYEPMSWWRRSFPRYWPGSAYVDALGVTMINFGGVKRYGVQRFDQRIRALHSLYRKPVLIAEANTQYGGRVAWLTNFRRMLRSMPWVTGVAWSQLPSRGAAQMTRPGDLHWDVQRDPRSAAVLRGIIDDSLAKGRQ